MKEVTITVNNKSYAVKVGDLNASPVQVEVNGKSYLVEMELPEVVEAQPVQNVQAVSSAPVAKRSISPNSETTTGRGIWQICKRTYARDYCFDHCKSRGQY